MGSGVVVMIDELLEDGLEMASSEDDEVIEQLSADGADPAFSEGICPWGPIGKPDHFGGLGAEDLVEGSAELGVAVVEEELDPDGLVLEVPDQVAGLLCNPFAGGVGGDAREMDATGTDFDEEEDVELTEPGGVHGEEVDGKDGVGVGANELAPGHPAAPRGRWYPVAA